jgi:hypothetical protein
MRTFGGADKGQTLRATATASDPQVVRDVLTSLVPELLAAEKTGTTPASLEGKEVAGDEKQNQKVSLNMQSRIGGSGGQRGRVSKGVLKDAKADYNSYTYAPARGATHPSPFSSLGTRATASAASRCPPT